MNNTQGPFTERQERIVEGLMEGLTLKEIARRTGISLSTVGQENTTIIRKMKSRKVSQAVGIYAYAEAYRNAAAQVLSVRVPAPDNEVDEHVNHVLEGIAHLFQDWAAQRLPK